MKRARIVQQGDGNWSMAITDTETGHVTIVPAHDRDVVAFVVDQFNQYQQVKALNGPEILAGVAVAP